MIAFGFLNPLLLWALPAAAIPVVIHLLNRRRFNKVRWAAMEYLLAAMRRNRRRLRMEQWLVLALRTLAVLLLILLVTRPQTSGSVLGDVRTHHVVCLDDSASMVHRVGAQSAFQAGLDYLRGLAGNLAKTRQGDLFTVLRASRPEKPDLLAVRIGPQLAGRVRDLLETLSAGDGVLDAAALLGEAEKRIGATPEASRAEIHFITDLRQHDWLSDEGKPRAAIEKQIARLDADRQHLTLVAVGPLDSQNLALVDLRREGRLAAAGLPVDLALEVKNQSAVASSPTEVALTVDGKSRVVRAVDSLQPGESRVLTFGHTFRDAGFHGVVASLPRDRYAPDDSRALSVEVVASSRVLLVDGDPGERPEEAETYFLAAALDQPGSGLSVEVIPDHALADQDLHDVDMIYLCNVPAPEPAATAKLKEFVAGGGGLVVFVGNQVDPRRYDERLYEDGKGLLPVPLTDLAGDLDRPQSVTIADRTHGTMAVATDTLALVFDKMVQVGRYMGVGDDPRARVILRVGGSSGDPLLISRHYGEGGGEVMLVTTTADIQWTSWPKTPAYLVVVQQMHRVAARVHDQSAYNLGPSGELHLTLDPARYRPDVVVRALREDGVERTFTARTESGVEGQPAAELTIPMADLRGTGLFELSLAPHAGEPVHEILARNTPVVEGRLERLTQKAWQRVLPAELRDRVTVVEGASSQGAVLTAGEGELWRGLALAMLAVLMIESLLAWRFGRR